MNTRKLLLVNKGLGREKILYLQNNFTSVQVVDVPEPAEDEEGGVKILSAAIIDYVPDVVIAGSRGAKILIKCLHNIDWVGPSLILAGMMPSGVGTFPPRVPMMVVHGVNDITIPILSVRLCASSGWVKLVEVEDDHSLSSILVNDKLKEFIEDLIKFSSSSPSSSSSQQNKSSSAAQSRSALLSAIKKKQQD